MSWDKKMKPVKNIATNRAALHNFTIIEKYEAGIVLTGDEVKSLRTGKVNLKEGFARIEHGELFLYNIHISPYSFAADKKKYDATRKRKLLLHKKEINKLIGKIVERGFTLVPIQFYFNKRGLAKVSLGVAKGKKLYDKRESLKKRDMQRETEKEIKIKLK